MSDRIDRRTFLRQVAVAAGGAVLSGTVAPEITRAAPALCLPPDRPWLKPGYKMEKGPIVYPSPGGSFTEKEYEAVFTPFTRLTGIKVDNIPITAGQYTQVRAQQAVGKVQIDYMEATWAALHDYPDIWIPLNYSIFPKATLDTMAPQAKQRNAIAHSQGAMVIAWSTKAFPGPDRPDSWAKFWDVRKYPGRRALSGDIFAPARVFEAALLADGVPKDKLYPVDHERAFGKLRQIKPHIVKWWRSPTEASYLLSSGEVDLIGIVNSRIENLMAQNLPFTYTINEALALDFFLGVVKGAPNPKAAMALIAFRFEPAVGAAIGELWQQPIPALAVWECAKPLRRARWTTGPGNIKLVVPINGEYWASKWPGDPTRSIQQVMAERFQQFIAS